MQPQPATMNTDQMHIRVKGKAVSVPSIQIDGRTIIATGKWPKIAAVQDEELVEGEVIRDPELFIPQLREAELRADIFSFAHKLPDLSPRYSYYREADSLAVVPITNYADWLQKDAKPDVRSAVKKAARLGVVTKCAEFNDELVEGIVKIYNECPIRQGKPFWHYKKDFTTVKQMSATYLNRSTFVCAYYKDELIGFIKMVRVGNDAFTVHVISMIKHFDKKATNALIAKAVEVCAETGMAHLVYGNFVYKDPSSSLTEFKRRNGFREVLVPRYYVPLTVAGRIALKTKLHHGISGILPQPVWKAVVKTRASILEARTRAKEVKQVNTGV